MSNDLGKDFRNFSEKLKDNLKNFPVIAASVAQNFFLDSWKHQAWVGDSMEPWKKRKKETKRTAGRPLLTGPAPTTLRRNMAAKTAIKEATWNRILITNDTPYASVHNDGYRGTFTRTATRKARTKSGYKKLGDEKIKSRKMAVLGVTHQVHQNIPRRRFMGDSPYLNMRIDRAFINELSKIK